MDLNEYQKLAYETAVYPDKGKNALYPACGMSGEAGECLDKIKKHWRNTDSYDPTTLSSEQRLEIIKEMGDVLWYIAALAEELDADLQFVAKANLSKLADRRARGVIKSEGDNR